MTLAALKAIAIVALVMSIVLWVVHRRLRRPSPQEQFERALKEHNDRADEQGKPRGLVGPRDVCQCPACRAAREKSQGGPRDQ